MALHQNPRITFLGAIAGLLVAFDRQILQYHRYSWDSLLSFFTSWFLHYIVVILIIGVAYALARGSPSALFGKSESLEKLTLDDGAIYGLTIVIVASVAIFVIAHWPAPDMR